MKRTLLTGVLLFGASLWAADTTVVADAHVSAVTPLLNFGNLPQVTVDANNRAYLQFDLATVVPPGATPAMLTRATLVLYAGKAPVTGAVGFAPVCGSWSESALTNHNAPAACPSGGGTFNVAAANEVLAIDVTNIVQAWMTGNPANNGIVLTSQGASVSFDSKESTSTSQPARLVLTFGIAGLNGPAGDTGAQGAKGPDGDSGPPGIPDQNGLKGQPGDQGNSGNQGTPGAPGSKGQTGAQGTAGIKGVTGDRGLAGVTGANGADGPPGVQGSQGPPGPQGGPGPKGGTGNAGPPGVSGIGKYAWSFADVLVGGGNTILTRQCPANQKLVSGGCGFTAFSDAQQNIIITTNGADFDKDLDADGAPRDWNCAVLNGTFIPQTVRVASLCRAQ
jgi:Collagen triple helix repeat (20 copies)